MDILLILKFFPIIFLQIGRYLSMSEILYNKYVNAKNILRKFKNPLSLDRQVSTYHAHLKTGDLEHGQQNTVPECYKTLTKIVCEFYCELDFKKTYIKILIFLLVTFK